MAERTTRSNSTKFNCLTESFSLDQFRIIVDDSKKEVLQSINEVKEDFNKLQTHLLKLDLRISSIEQSISGFQNVQKTYQSEMNGIKCTIAEIQNMQNQQPIAFNDLMNEIEEREKRRENIMIFGLDEKQGTVDERRFHDKQMVGELFETIDLEDVEFTDCLRIGKHSGNKPRPLKIKLKDRNKKLSILRKSKELRTSTRFKAVYISSDLTKSQQSEQFLLRKELKRQNDAGQNMVLYNGQLRRRDSLRNFRN